ncbi:MAG: hypothetical protein B6243_13185 [Anaerolineaceae bacterium 4572_5.2]|nr:MAG: hypothetical protein B6243_13185 [Anaerolineaceae bacterium 4572_5.2]
MLTSKQIVELADAAARIDRGSLTKAGRALQKHGNRPNSAFPKPFGNIAIINRAGQNVVNDILTNPSSQIDTRQTKRFGKVTEIRAPDGRGIRYDNTGSFIGFLEP